MKKLALLLCLLAAAPGARADIVIQQSMEIQGLGDAPAAKPQTVTIKIKGDQTRTDNGETSSTIADLATGDGVRMVHAQKGYIKITAAQTREMVEKVKATSGTVPTEPPKLIDTGKTETVNGHEAKIYTAEVPGRKFTYWISKDVPDFAVVQSELKRVAALKQKSLGVANNFIPDPSQLDGLPVKTEVVTDAGADGNPNSPSVRITLTLISAKEEPVDAALFKIPEGYTELKRPAAAAVPAAK